MNWGNQHVLVTGADGFIGSHLAERLVREGARVRALACYNSFGSWGWLDHLEEEVRNNMHVMPGDIRDTTCLARACKGVETIFHLAALIGIPYSYVAPNSYVDVNVVGTINVLQAARQLEVSRVVCTSTSEVYGTAIETPIRETHPKQAQSPYSASKIGADAIAESYYRSFGLPVVVARPFNTYGPRQSARAFIPTVITQLLSGHREILLGNTRPTRDLVFVADTVEGFLRLALCDNAIGREVNIATGDEYSIGDVASIIIDEINSEARIVTDPTRVRPPKSEVERLIGSNALLKELTDWTPSTKLKTGLAQTIEWFRKQERMSWKSSEYVV